MSKSDNHDAISNEGVGAGFCLWLTIATIIVLYVVFSRLSGQIAGEAYHYDVRELSGVKAGGADIDLRERSRRLLPYLTDISTAPAISSADKRNAARLVRTHDCLTEALYYEARGESVAGRLAVGEVIGNRVISARFPDEVCAVIYQGSDRQTGCQFSFTCDGSMLRPPQPEVWRRAAIEASHLLLDLHIPATDGATHYHADYVEPEWAGGLIQTARIGAHLFYRPLRDANGRRVRPSVAAAPKISPVGQDRIIGTGLYQSRKPGPA